jgi:superoxide dismutase, Cu-Zn family
MVYMLYGGIMRLALSVVAASMMMASCSTMGQEKPGAVGEATLQPTAGNSAAGKVTFTQQAKGVLVEANVTGLKPGMHGFHIHEKGDCSAPDAMSAGGHFNPTGSTHGGTTDPRHAGDLGNITADANGNAQLKLEVGGITVDTGPNGIVGRSMIVHADPDDLKTQPTGNSGKRVACGMIASKQ